MLADFNNSFTVRTRNYFCCNLTVISVCYLITSVWRLIMVLAKRRRFWLKTCGNQKATVRGLLKNFQIRTVTERDWIMCWRDCVRRVLWNGWLVAAGDAWQSTVDMAIEQWRGRRRACVHAKGGHFEHSLWTYWWCWLCQPFITSV